MTRFHRACLTSLAAVILAGSARTVSAQEILQEILDPVKDAGIGLVLRPVGDFDGDGFVDVMTLATGAAEPSVVYVLSGSDGSVFHRFAGGSSATYYGLDLAGGADFDGDGVGDFAIGESGYPTTTRRGRVHILSGADGSLLHQWNGEADNDWFGQSIDIVPDLNGDGLDEWLIGAPYFNSHLDDVGKAYVYAGGTGALIHRLQGKADGYAFGVGVAALDDVDVDGFHDFAVIETNVVNVYSGQDGRLLFDLDDKQPGEVFWPWRVEDMSDLDGDSIGDVVVSAVVGIVGQSLAHPRVITYSGATGQQIFALDGQTGRVQETYPYHAVGVGDVNGDGLPDLLLGEGLVFFSVEDGTACLISGLSGKLLYEFRDEVTDSPIPGSVAAVGDYNRDGLSDFAIGSALRGPGRIRIHSGARLFLDSSQREPSEGDSLELRVGEGSFGEPSIMFVTEVNGSPIFQPLFGIGLYDADGFRRENIVVPAGIRGTQFTLRAFASHGGNVVASANEVVTIQ